MPTTITVQSGAAITLTLEQATDYALGEDLKWLSLGIYATRIASFETGCTALPAPRFPRPPSPRV